MTRVFLLLAGVGISAVLAGGCALHGNMHGRSHQAAQHGTALIAEVERDGIVVTLRVPPLVSGQEAVLSVSARDAGSGQPIPEAAVSVAVGPIQDLSSDHAGHGPADAAGDRMEAAFDDGEYRVRYTPSAPGVYEVRASVERSGRESPAVVATTVHVDEVASGHGTVTPLAVLAAAGMAVMMLVRWIVF